MAYDFVEWLRPKIDKAVLIFLRQNKKPILKVNSKDIRYFIAKIKKLIEHRFYHKEQKVCISLNYWIDLNLLEFRNTVSEKR